MAYSFGFFIIVLNTYLFKHIKRKKGQKWPWVFLGVLLCFIIYISAFRGSTGTDTIKIYGSFYNNYVAGNVRYSGVEYGFLYLCRFAYLLKPSYEMMLCVISLVIWCCIFYSLFHIKELKASLVVSAFFMYAMYLGPSFNIMRQMLAVSVFLVAYTKIIERNLLQYTILVLIATLFHTSAIVMYPLYFIYSGKKNNSLRETMINIGIFMLPFIFVMCFQFLINLDIFSKYNTLYGDNLDFEFRPQRIFIRLPLYVLEIYLYRKTRRKFEQIDRFSFKLILLEFISIWIGFFNLWAYRMLYFFSIGHLLFCLSTGKKLRKNKKIIPILIMLYCLFYFIISHYLWGYDGLFPYQP